MFQNTPEDLLCDRDGEYRRYRNKNEEKERKNVMSLKNNKHFRCFAAALMAGTMMVSMFGMTTFAQGNNGSEPTEPTEPEACTVITKKLEKDENLYLPATTFTFTITGAEESDLNDEVKNGVAVQAGETGDVVFSDGSRTGTITATAGTSTAAETVTLGALDVKIADNATFDGVGIYRYVIQESNENPYPGVNYDTAKRYLDVYVMHSNSGGYAYYFSIVDSENTSTKDDGNINNTYKYTNGGLYDLKVTKNIEGNQGILTEKFDFSIQITADHEGEKFHVVVYNKDDVQQRAETIEVAEGTRKGTVSPISLGDDEYVVVYGLSAGDRYTVTETAANKNGYVTTCKVNDIDTDLTDDGAVSNNSDITGDVDITFVNTRDAATPTGVVLNIAPYIAMVALAGVLAFVFLRRRHNNF